MHPGIHVGMFGQQIPGPVKSTGRGFVTRHHQRHHLVNERALRHRIARLLVPRVHEHAQIVEMLRRFRPASGHQARDQLGQRAELVGEFEVPGRFLSHDRKRIATRLLREGDQILAEDGSQDDLQRQLAHVVGEVDELAAGGLRGPPCQ